MSENVRVYNIPDADLQQAGELMVVALPDDNAAFTAFDSTITATYPASIRAALDQAKEVETNEKVVQELADLTAKLNEAHQNCYTAFLTIAYFVRKAFDKNPAMQKKFGLVEIRKAQGVQTRFIRFMQDLAKVAEQNKDALILAGCSPATIAGLTALAKALLDADVAQEKFKKDRGILTQDRIGYLNELYNLLKPIDEVAQIIYRNDAARMAKYMLPRASKPGPDSPAGGGPASPSPS